MTKRIELKAMPLRKDSTDKVQLPLTIEDRTLDVRKEIITIRVLCFKEAV